MGTGGPPPLLPPEKLYSFLIRSCAELGVPQGLPRFAQSLTNLTSVFGMGTGGSPPPLPPEKLMSFVVLIFQNCTATFNIGVI